MKIIETSTKHPHGFGPFQIEVLYPGEALGLNDSGFLTIGRIDHARLKPGMLVGMHPHQDDEILSYMRSGTMIHRDNVGKEVPIHSSYLMLMNAGSGIHHEERINEDGEDAEMLQIFIRPSEKGLEPKVQFHQFENPLSLNEWRLLAADKENAPLRLRSGTAIYDTLLEAENSLTLQQEDKYLTRFIYCFNGTVDINGKSLKKGESVVSKEEKLEIKAVTTTDLLLFEIDERVKYYAYGMFSGNQFRRR